MEVALGPSSSKACCTGCWRADWEGTQSNLSSHPGTVLTPYGPRCTGGGDLARQLAPELSSNSPRSLNVIVPASPCACLRTFALTMLSASNYTAYMPSTLRVPTQMLWEHVPGHPKCSSGPLPTCSGLCAQALYLPTCVLMWVQA